MSTAGLRHLVLVDAPDRKVKIACQPSSPEVPYDRNLHTLLTRFTTCNECLAVHTARLEKRG